MNTIVYDHQQMRQADLTTISRTKLPGLVLMERAALGIAEKIRQIYAADAKILVVCGSGNNGADGVAAARILYLSGYDPVVYYAGNMSHTTEQMQVQQCAYEVAGGHTAEELPDLTGFDLIVDAIFGIGLDREVSGAYKELIEQINAASASVLSVDIPSGIHAGSGQVLGTAVKADITVTFSYLKSGLLLYPGKDYSGELVLADAGILPLGDQTEKAYFTMTVKSAVEKLPARSSRSNKGTYGHAFLYTGNEHIAGAAILSARGAYAVGCGLTSVYTHPVNRNVLLSVLPEALYMNQEEISLSEDTMKKYKAAAAGPGIGTDLQAFQRLKELAQCYHGPLVLDADALNLLADALHGQNDMAKVDAQAILSAGNVIITPHPGEMARLCNVSVPEILKDFPGYARALSFKYGLICVLKDAATVVTDNRRIYINQTGTNGMAVGGSGDVLCGMITGLLAQGMEPYDAACTAVCLHGAAGEAAAAEKGERSMLAGDIINYLPKIIIENN